MKLTTDKIKSFLTSKFKTKSNQMKSVRKYKNNKGQVVRELLVTQLVEVISSPEDTSILAVNSLNNSATLKSSLKNKFNDYYFCVEAKSVFDKFYSVDVVSVCINPKKYWDTEKAIYDEPIKITKALEKFRVISPNDTVDFVAYEYNDFMTVFKLLEELGLEYNNDMARHLKSKAGMKCYIKP